MRFLNANAMIGAHFAPRERRFFGADDLIEEMDFFGIDEALVYHGLAFHYSLEDGNERIVEETAGYPHLHPCWMAGEHHSGEHAAPADFVRSALAHQVAAIRLSFGIQGGISFPDILAYGELFGELEKHRFPTFLGFESLTPTASDIGHLDGVLRAFPDLPVILSAMRMPGEIVRLLHARLDTFRNLRVESVGVMSTGGLESIVRRFGADRLVFSTWFPFYGSGQTRIALAYADLSDEDRHAIAYLNMKNLIGGILQ